ncbi:MAG: SAM-dependent methyltransferase, partial [Halieaceae bacterium]|nr:SAM-dependent methyltransferase [Halieaceae bacterium]
CQRVHITILDHPAQLQIAAETLKQAGFAGRFDVLPIDLLAEGPEFPSGVDAIWMSQVLDCFSPAQITHILGRARQCLGKQATLYILETFWDRQRFATSAFSLVNTSLYFTCIANGNSKMYHSNDLKACAQEAGLCLRKETDSIGIGHTLLEYRLA